MSDLEKNQDSDFMSERIKERPVNKKKLLRRTVITASMAVIFGLIACFTFLVLEPVFSNWLYPEEEPEIIVLPDATDEMLPEDMLTEDDIQQETETEVKLEEEQIEQILSGVQLDLEDYERIGSYIPTRSSVAILKRYLEKIVLFFYKRDKKSGKISAGL